MKSPMTKMAMMGAGILAFMLPSDYAAAAVSDETAFIFNTF